MRRLTATVAVALAVQIGGLPAVLGQGADDAKRHFIQGRKYFKQGKYDAAMRSFRTAHKIRPSPLLEYNIGRCHEELAQRDEAISAYQRYLDARPNATNREEVLDRIAKLEAASPPEPKAPEPKAPESKAPESKAPPAEAPPSKPAPAKAAPPEATKPEAPRGAPEPPHEAEPAGRQLPPPGTSEEPGMPAIKDGRDKVAMSSGGGAVHEAAQPPAGRGGDQTRGAGRPAKEPQRRPGRPEEGPIYKQWWFWVGCAAGAVIVGFIIGTAASKGGSSETRATSGGLQISF